MELWHKPFTCAKTVIIVKKTNININCNGNKSNNTFLYNNMKHSILLLSSYGFDYINNFLDQFNNNKRYEIFYI